jgi:polyhydroxybutyrate depolymerase
MMETTGFNDIADREGFIVAYPDGLNRSWADGRGETPSDKKGINDVKYFTMLIDKIADKYRVDTSKVFVTGHSNGGAMTNRLGFDISTRLAGIAPIGANVSAEMVKNFSSEKHIPVLFINGTADEFIPFEGGPGKSTEFIYPSVMEIFNKWKSFEGCEGDVIPDTIDNYDDGTFALIYNFNCENEPVKMIKIVNAGHGYPGGISQLPEFLLGKYTKEINASEEIWKFFKASMK